MNSASFRSKLAALTLLAGCTNAAQLPASSSARTHDFGTYSIQVPSDWRRIDLGEGQSHGGLHGFLGERVKFQGPSGEYIDVLPELATEVQSADNWWTASEDSTGAIHVEGSTSLCRPPSPAEEKALEDVPAEMRGHGCYAGDGRLDVWMAFVVRNQSFVIMLGNERREKIEDLAQLRAILQTFRVK